MAMNDEYVTLLGFHLVGAGFELKEQSLTELRTHDYVINDDGEDIGITYLYPGGKEKVGIVWPQRNKPNFLKRVAECLELRDYCQEWVFPLKEEQEEGLDDVVDGLIELTASGNVTEREVARRLLSRLPASKAEIDYDTAV